MILLENEMVFSTFALELWAQLQNLTVNSKHYHYNSIWNNRILSNAQLRHYLMSELVIIANILMLKELEEKDAFKDSDDKENELLMTEIS